MKKPFTRGQKITIWSIIATLIIGVGGWMVFLYQPQPLGSSLNINGNDNQVIVPTAPDSPGLHFSDDTFKESHPEIYGSYSYIQTGNNSPINVTSQSDTFYGATHTIMQSGNNSPVKWSSTDDQVGK